MPKVCYNKPNRKKIRVFTAKDVRRIAKYAQEDGAHPLEILAGVAVFLGLGWVFCVMARVIDNSFNILGWVAKVGGVVALGRIVDFLLTVVSGGLFKRLPGTSRYTLVIVLTLGVLESILTAVQSLLHSAGLIKDASELAHDLCHRAKEVASEVGEVVGERYDDTADFSKDAFKRITASEVDKAFKIRGLP
jgi:hypothetical protein